MIEDIDKKAMKQIHVHKKVVRICWKINARVLCYE